MTSKSMLALCAFTLTIAYAGSTHRVTLNKSEWVGNTELTPGTYSIEIDGDKAVVKKGKTVIDLPARAETMPTKFENTSFHTHEADGKNQLEEIWIGGTNMKVIMK